MNSGFISVLFGNNCSGERSRALTRIGSRFLSACSRCSPYLAFVFVELELLERSLDGDDDGSLVAWGLVDASSTSFLLQCSSLESVLSGRWLERPSLEVPKVKLRSLVGSRRS